MKIGYARVSTEDQNLHLQVDALHAAGCELIFKEKVSSKNKERPELSKLVQQLRKGDDVIVWKLDRLGISLKDLIGLVTIFQGKEAGFISLQDGINTSTATGRFTFKIFTSLAEFEKGINRERTMAGLQSARARGRKGGRPAGLNKEALDKAHKALILYDKGDKRVDDIADVLEISRVTCYRYLKIAREQEQKMCKIRKRSEG